MRHVSLTRTRQLLSGAAASALVALATPAAALPVLSGAPPQVSSGGLAPIVTSNGSTLQVDLNAPRTIIDWANFNLSNTEQAQFRFDQRNWIVLNRVASGAISINGTITAGQAANFQSPAPGGPSGNVWFYSPGGVAFGPNARVDVGGLLATSAAADPTAFLNASNLNIPFTGSGSGGPVTVAGGAALSGTAHLAFIAPRVDTASGSTFNVGDYGSVLYGGADSFEVQLFPTFNNDLTIFTFIVPNAAAGTPVASALNIAGTTRAGTIYLAAYSRAALAGTVINAPGQLTAASSFAEYGQVTITTGRSILLGQVGAGSEAQQVSGVTTGGATVGTVNADGNVNVYLTGTGSLGDFRADRVRAGQGLLMAAQNITIGAGGLSSGDANVNARNMVIDSAGVINVPLINAGTDLSIIRGPAQTGRSAATAVSTLQLTSVTAGRDIVIGNAGTIDATTVTAGRNLQMAGSLAVRPGAVTSSGLTRISAGQNIRATNVRGVDLDLSSATGVQANLLAATNGVTVNTGGFANLTTVTGASFNLDSPNSQLGTVTVSGDVRLRVGAVGLLTSLTATNLTLEAAKGDFVLGGTNPGELADFEIQRIRVTNSFSVYAGLTAPTQNVPNPVGGDLIIKAVTFDPSKIPNFYFYADSNHAVRIIGPTDTVGDPRGFVRIGDPTPGSKWAPKLVTFSDGSDPVDFAKAMNADVLRDSRVVEVYASGDILIGSQRFIDLVLPIPGDQIDLARGLPLGVAPTPDEVDRAYLSAGRMTLVAGGRILTQNTSSRPDFGLGIVVSGLGVPADQPILTLGRAQTVDIFASILSPSTGLNSGPTLSISNRVARLPGDPTGQSGIRVNGCALGIGCGVSTAVTQFRVETFEPPAAPVATAAIDPPLLQPPPKVSEEQDDEEAVTIGAGNEEIWRRPQP